MKKNVFTKLLLSFIVSIFFIGGCVQDNPGDTKKLYMYHEGEIIEISYNAYDAHKAHGDIYLGNKPDKK